MSQKAIGLTLAACAALWSGNTAFAGADVGSWYVAPQVQGIFLDKSRKADDDAGFQASLGLVASPKWNIEFAYSTSNHNQAAGQKLTLQGYQVAMQRVFYRDQRVNPYFTVGLGKFDINPSIGPSSGHLGATYGVGLVADIMKNTLTGTNLQFRGELLGRRTSGDQSSSNSPTDYIAGIGLQYNWGGQKVQPKPLDSDGDGVPDSLDKCPGTPPGAAVDANGCELDSDGDGVVDRLDKCPDTPKGDRVDMFGCSFKTEIKLPGVVFDTNSAELKSESYSILDGAAAVLKRYPELKVEVAGHTDGDGSAPYNLALSDRRAKTVMQYLKDKGAANQLSAKGYGKRQPIASNKSAEGKAENRRVVLRVLN